MLHPNQTQIDLNRLTVYEFVAGKNHIPTKDIIKENPLGKGAIKYLNWLSEKGYLSRYKKIVDGQRMWIYNAGMPYTIPDYDKDDSIPDLVKQNLRVFKLTDVALPTVKTGYKYSGLAGSIQSIMGAM
jgi:hypothetical protein